VAVVKSVAAGCTFFEPQSHGATDKVVRLKQFALLKMPLSGPSLSVTTFSGHTAWSGAFPLTRTTREQKIEAKCLVGI
jgi:hypothetical protein